MSKPIPLTKKRTPIQNLEAILDDLNESAKKNELTRAEHGTRQVLHYLILALRER